MKLDQLLSGLSGVAMIVTLSLAGLAIGCSGATAQTPAHAAARNGIDAARVSDAVAITHLMSAQLPGPAPRVGKSHLASDDDGVSPSDGADTASGSETDGESAPKMIRRSDGSRRHGGFGTTK